MFFILNTKLSASRTMSAFGPFATVDEAEIMIANLQPGTYQIFGPAPAGESYTVAKPVVTKNP